MTIEQTELYQKAVTHILENIPKCTSSEALLDNCNGLLALVNAGKISGIRSLESGTDTPPLSPGKA
jgi:hypothetical protein